MKLIVKNIGFLLNARNECPDRISGKEMARMPVLNDAWIFVENGLIHSFGTMDHYEESAQAFDPSGSAQVTDALGGMTGPAWCDSHTHIVYAAPREKEFVDRKSTRLNSSHIPLYRMPSSA
mgnify:CR=1 FL=1